MNRITSFLTALALAVLGCVSAAYAHSEAERTVFDIPFEFTIGGVSLPGGQYEFVRATPFIYQIRDRNGRRLFAMASAAVQSGGMRAKSNLTFDTVGGRHVLVQIWNQNSASAYAFPYSTPSNSSDSSGVSTTVERVKKQLEL